MPVLTTPSETRELLAHYGIKPVSDDTGGGVLVTIVGRVDEAGHKVIELTRDKHRVLRTCPVSEGEVRAMVDALLTAGKDVSFEHLVRHLIARVSHMYAESGIDAFHLESVRLHPTGHTIGNAKAWRTQPLHLRPRQQSEEHALHQSFPHRPGGRR